DVAVELDVVEIELRGFDLKRLFFVEVAQGEEVLMTKQGVVVEVHLRVERDEPFVFGQEEGIDLEERRIGLLVSCVERLHELRRRIDQIGRQAQTERELARLIGPETYSRINHLLHDL